MAANSNQTISPVLFLKQICIDCFLLITVGLSMLFIKKLSLVFQRGFFCNDNDLLHPFVKSNFQNQYYHPIGFLTIASVIILTEFLQKCNNFFLLWKLRIPSWLFKVYQILLCFGFGLLCSMLMVTTLKSSVGRLRPHFIAVCGPDIDCSIPSNQHIYHVSFNCTKNLHKPGLLLNSRLSFPSGHSNFAMFCAVFFVMYIQQRMTWRGSKLAKVMLQFLAILSAICIGLTRVMDYYHHGSDVMGGFVIGASSAAWVTLKMDWSSITTNYISYENL